MAVPHCTFLQRTDWQFPSELRGVRAVSRSFLGMRLALGAAVVVVEPMRSWVVAVGSVVGVQKYIYDVFGPGVARAQRLRWEAARPMEASLAVPWKRISVSRAPSIQFRARSPSGSPARSFPPASSS